MARKIIKKNKGKNENQKRKKHKGLIISLIIIFIFIILFLFISCNLMNNNNSLKETFGIVVGSGNVVSQTREVGYFDKVELKRLGNVYITQGETNKLIIEAENNLLPYLSTDVINNELVINKKRSTLAWIIKKKPINIYVTIKDVNELVVLGSGDIISNSLIETTSLKLKISGSGNINVNTSTNYLETGISGSGRITVNGIANTHYLYISGSGNVNALDLVANNTNVMISGSGNAKVNAIDELNIKISGSGNIQYTGDPKVNTSISGSGSVKKI